MFKNEIEKLSETEFANNLNIRRKQIEKGIKADGIKTALIVQGGGMRGIYSMSALQEIENSIFAESFDYVVGSSAGAINGAYFLASQSKEATDVYLNEISNNKFIDFKRVFEKKIVNIDFLIDSVLSKNKNCQLNVKNVMESGSELHMILTDIHTAKRKVFTNRNLELDNINIKKNKKSIKTRLMKILKGTSALPLLFDEVVKIDGRGYIDGGVLDPLPVSYAINELKCTDILIIITRPLNFRRKNILSPMRRFVKSLLKTEYCDELKKIIIGENRVWIELYNETMDKIEKGGFYEPNVRVNIVYPSDTKRLVKRTTRDSKKLIDCADMGRADMKLKLTKLNKLINTNSNKSLYKSSNIKATEPVILEECALETVET